MKRKLNEDLMHGEETARLVARLLNGTFFERVTITAGANGNATVAHGLGTTPTFLAAGIIGDTVNHCDVESADATDVTLRVKDSTGADVTSGSHDIWLIASTTLDQIDF